MFYPEYFVDTVFNIDYCQLKLIGIKHILIDVDNTIVPFKDQLPTDRIKDFIKEGKSNGFDFCIVSNTFLDRVKRIGDCLDIPYISGAKKPLSRGVINGMKLLNGTVDNTILIGDQFCTDIIAAKRAGIRCILVEPIVTSDFFMTKIYRFIEWFFKRNFKKENMKDEE